jgi:hypothetical protein
MRIQEIFENRAGSLPQQIKPIKMPTPPKAPDATTPVGRTTDAGVSYKQDKHNPNLVTVSNASGHYTFDGARLVRWITPLPQYKQIHDFVNKTITLDANTVAKTENGEVVINQKAVYDMQGNLKQGSGSVGYSAGGLAVRVSDKDGYNMSYYISDIIQFRLKSNNQKAKNVNPNVIKKAMAMMQKRGDVYSTFRGFNLLNKLGDVKWLVNGKATHPTEVATLIRNGKI